jgi:ABC-type uncharacterized transport system permease subunit
LHIDPLLAYGLVLSGAVGSPYALSETLLQAIPLILAGMAISVAFTARLWNIGAEGQLYAGAIASVLIGLNILGLPPVLLLPLGLACGAVAGAIWGAIPAVLKVRFGAHEVLVTIMLNYVAILLSSMVIRGPWADPAAPQTRQIENAATLPVIIPGTRLHAGILIALAAAVVVWFLLYKTTVGFKMRSVGSNPDASRAGGISVAFVTITTFCISGALAGLAGASLVLGTQHSLVDGLSADYGYTAIAVALIGRLHPLGTVLGALFFAALYVGSQYMQIATGVPGSFVQVIQGVLLLTVLAAGLVNLPSR